MRWNRTSLVEKFHVSVYMVTKIKDRASRVPESDRALLESVTVVLVTLCIISH